ncbi:MAG: DNA polymerase I [Endomicrobium sp.]|jgi:DNA polymerase-1|nr:DNA polymerase I [Endomicrobium sp.]
MKRFFVIDGNAYVHRAYHAFPPFFTSDNRQVNAIYGFMKLLFKIKNNFKPDYIAVCFDYPSKNFRHEIFSEYKANRKPIEKALIDQMPIAREAVEALGVEQIEIEGYEADDLIATITENNKKNNVQTVIVTGDKDILQLIENGIVSVWDDSKDVMYDTNKVKEKYNVTPKQLSDVFALMGDVADNIPGVRGIGEKTAIKLIKEFETLGNVLENINSTKGNIRKLLQSGKDQALLSKKLIELNRYVPLDYKLEAFKNKNLDRVKAVPFLKKYEFKSFLSKYFDNNYETKASVTTTDPQQNEKQKTHFHHTDNLTTMMQNLQIGDKFCRFEIINTYEKAVEVAKIIEKATIISMKTIGSLEDSLKAKIVGVSFSIENEFFIESFYFPLGHNDLTLKQMTFTEFKKVFAALLSSNKLKKIGHDLKQERNIYKMSKIDLTNIYFDTMIASYCLNPTESHDMSLLAKKHLDFTIEDEKKGIKIKTADLSIQNAAKYANSISVAAFIIYKIFDLQIKTKKLAPLFFNIEMPLIEVLSEMEIAGIEIDLSFLHNFNEKIVSEFKKAEGNIYKIADKEFNINSSKQLASILFEKFNLPVIKKTKTGYSTDEAVLTELSYHELPKEVLNYRELQKLKSTYVDPIINYCAYYGNRIHTIFNQAVTATGRLSSTEPNLQNIPIRSDYGKQLRKMFIPSNNKIFVSADYSQIDLRVLAHVSKDQKLIEAFKDGADIHSATAREIFNIQENEPLSDTLRGAAKSINFGIVYGMSPFGLSKQLNISVAVAKEYIDGYFKRYCGVKSWMEQIVEQASRDGYVRTITNRMRYIPELLSTNAQFRNTGERIALNTPVQGSSADIIKIAMINIYNEFKFKNYKSLMLLQVHDDLLFEVPREETENAISFIKYQMENAITLSVPLVVNIKIGGNWGEMEQI